jgi:hypothetical protein
MLSNRTNLIILLPVILLFSVFIPQQISAQRFGDYLQFGKVELEKENYTGAIKYLNSAIKHRPASYEGYFIPLGNLKHGKYHLNIKIKEKIHYRVEVLSNHFDPFVDRSVCPDRKENIHFTIDEPVNVFLRIRSKEPLHVIALEIKKDNG